MEAGNKNVLEEEEYIVRNPTQCTAPVTGEKMGNSPFLIAMGVMGDILLYRIKRPPATALTRCPWGIQNLSKRHSSTVPDFYGNLLVQEAQMIRNLNSVHIAGAILSDNLEECKRSLLIEYLSSDLADILAKRYKGNLGPLEAPKAIKASFDILSALDYLHTDVLMLHGDLKSFNVLVQGDFENVKVCGLGPMSKSLNPDGCLDRDLNPDDETIGVGLWSAPEVFANTAANITSKADIFAFGLIIYEMLVCMPPHTFPGIMDLVIAAPTEIIKVRNSQKERTTDFSNSAKDDDEYDDDRVFIDLEADPRKKYSEFLKRKFGCKVTIRKDLTKKMKYDGVIIDLDDEEEATPKDNASGSKENEPIHNEGNSGNAIETKDQELTLCQPASATVENEAAGAPLKVAGSTEKIGQEDITETEKPTANLINANEAADSPLTVETSTVLDGDIADNENRTVNSEKPDALSTKSPEVSSEVVTVFDSSDEENDAPNKAYEVNSSDSSIHDDYGSDEDDVNQYSEEFGETDEDYDATDDIQADDWDMDANFLNYGCLGTRPPIPVETTFGKEYNILLEMFIVCTKKTIALRPNAAQILKAYRDTKPDQP